MKNSQKGSATLWIVIVVVVLVVVGAGYYIFSSGKGVCRITRGTVTTYEPCPETASGTQDVVQSEYDRVGQAMKEVASKYLKNAPSGFLYPSTVPKGYKPQPDPTLFESNEVGYFYTTNRGVPADKNLIFEESSNGFGFGDYDGYLTFIATENMKLVKEFSYNSTNGKVFSSNTNVFTRLVYNDNGKVLTIDSINDPSITADTLISLLKAMKDTP